MPSLAQQPNRPPFLLLVIAYLGFVSLGLPDTVIGVAWPSVRETFGLSQSALGLVFFGSACSYFLSSFFTGKMLQWLGIGLLLAISSGVVAVCCLGYGLAPAWGWFIVGAILHGVGSGAIDAGLNHYAARHFSTRHMNWLHGCYSLGATLGPLIMTTVLAAHYPWRTGYLVVAGILLILAALFTATKRQWDDSPPSAPVAESSTPAAIGMRDALRLRPVWLQIVLFFFYTGLESSMGNWSFTVMVESRGISRETAGFWVTLYWGSLCAGRFILGAIADRLGLDSLLRLSTLTALAGTLLFAANLSPALSAAALALTGLGLAAIYPCMMTKTPLRIGPAASAHAVGFQVSSAMIGVACLPSACGLLAQTSGLAIVPYATVGMAAAVLVLHEILLANDRRAASRKIAA